MFRAFNDNILGFAQLATKSTSLDEQTGKVSLRYIRTGRRFPDGNITVLSGLRPGETIALDPVEAGVAAKQGSGVKSDE